MKTFLFLFLLNAPIPVFSQSERTAIRNYQKGKLKEDTSYVYWLPYKENTSQLMVQGYFTKYSHKTLIANDFKMKNGTTICAARAGIVLDIMQSSNIGGLKDKENHWNYILITHDDGSTAIYGHIQQNGAKVNMGDTVTKGQEIGLSGNTGYSAFPHLHFQVRNKERMQIPVRFLTQYGKQYLRQLKLYKCLHKVSEKIK
jgi:murein DD-endopeptidase MepM/ murein hydrolase activator NlpD